MTDAVVARVPAAVAEPAPVAFAVGERRIHLLHGHSLTLKITASRGPSATDVINIAGAGIVPFAVAGTSGMIPKESNELTLKLDQNPEIPLVGTFYLQLTAQTAVDGRQETIQLPPVRTEIARPFALELLNASINISAGSKARIAAVVRREAPFEGTVKVGPAGSSLPQGVQLTTVDVGKADSLALLELTVDETVAPGELDLQIRASTDMEGRKRDKEYVIPDTPMKVKIAAKPGS
jgi:hypothetical protein